MDASGELVQLSKVPDYEDDFFYFTAKSGLMSLPTKAFLSHFLGLVKKEGPHRREQSFWGAYAYPSQLSPDSSGSGGMGPDWKVYMAWANFSNNAVPLRPGVSPVRLEVDDKRSRRDDDRVPGWKSRQKIKNVALEDWMVLRMQRGGRNGRGGIVKSPDGDYALGWRIWYTPDNNAADYPHDSRIYRENQDQDSQAVKEVLKYILQGEWVDYPSNKLTKGEVQDWDDLLPKCHAPSGSAENTEEEGDGKSVKDEGNDESVKEEGDDESVDEEEVSCSDNAINVGWGRRIR